MGFIDSAKEFFARRPTAQEQKVNTNVGMEPLVNLTSQIPKAPEDNVLPTQIVEKPMTGRTDNSVPQTVVENPK